MGGLAGWLDWRKWLDLTKFWQTDENEQNINLQMTVVIYDTNARDEAKWLH